MALPTWTNISRPEWSIGKYSKNRFACSVFKVAIGLFITIFFIYDLKTAWLRSKIKDFSSKPAKEDNNVRKIPFSIATANTSNGILPMAEASNLCRALDLSVFPRKEDRSRKVFDLFMVNTELEWVEIRLNELAPYVDYFVIVESATTFSNKEKPLYFKDNFKRFEKFRSQIIYQPVDLSGFKDKGAWDRERYTRNGMFDLVFPTLLPPQAANMGDVILVSDLDEIPKPQTIITLRNCEFPERTSLRSRMNYYSFQLEGIGADWPHPQATFYQGPERTIKPESLRSDRTTLDFKNGAWHCSYCFPTIKETVQKLQSFSHTELNLPKFVDPAGIVRRIKNGLDIFDRSDSKFKQVDTPDDMPKYIKENKERFAYLYDRKSESANFKDYTP